MANFLSATDHRKVAFCILDNFYSDNPEVVVEEGTTIVRLDHIENADVRAEIGEAALSVARSLRKCPDNVQAFESPRFLYPPTARDLFSHHLRTERPAALSSFAILTTYRWTGPVGYGNELLYSAQRRIDTILTALRLCKEEHVGRHHLAEIHYGDAEVVGGMLEGVTERWGRIRGNLRATPYYLKTENVSRFHEMYGTLMSLDQPRLAFAFDRFNHMYYRESWLDILLDWAMAFESVFTSDGNSEVTYKLSTRAARYLATTYNDRKQIHKTVKDGYDLRSKTLHGLKPALDSQDVDPTVVQPLRKLLREVLLKAIRETRKDTFSPKHLSEIDLE